MFSVTLLVVSCGILAAAYPYSQQYGNYDQQYSQQSQYYPSSGQQGYRGGYQSNPGMQGGYQGNGQDSYQDFQGYQGYQRGQGGQRGYQGYQSNQRSQGSYPERYDSSMYSPVMDLTNYYGSQGTPQYYGYPSSASYQMTPYYQNQNQGYMQQQQYNTPSQSSWSPMYYGNGYQSQQSQQQQSSMGIRPYQSSWGQTQGTNTWGSPYQFTKVDAQVTDDDNVDGSGMDSSEQTSSPASTDDSQMTSNDD